MITFAVGVVFVSYAAFVLALYIGWRKTITGSDNTAAFHRFISVIIPARNEEKNIGSLLDDLFAQRYPPGKMEILVVDDHSEDRTAEIVNEKIKNVSFGRIILSVKTGKKSAITTGVEHARGEIIVTTDADCSVNPDWLISVNNKFSNDEVKMVFGPVKIDHGNSFFSTIQSVEFASLVGSGAATMAMDTPTMSNGANLAFLKKTFPEVGGYNGNFQVASGDDEFLMRKISDKYPGSIRFNNSKESIVTTQPQRTLTEFISQRIRWAGKWKYHSDLKSKMLAVYIFLLHLTVLMLPVFYVTELVSPVWIIAFVLLKLLAEFVFLLDVVSWLGVRWNWPAFLSLQLLYPFYAIMIGISSFFVSPSWKGRK